MNLLALVLAGGEGTRLHPLTKQHAKPALPFAEGRRIVDFVLSNLVNSAIGRICVLAQYKPESLVDHIEGAWRSRFAAQGVSIEVVLPPPAAPGAAQYKGTADAVYRNLELIRRHAPDLVAVFAADHVYRMDVRQMVRFHEQKRAEVTIAAVRVPLDIAPSFGILDMDGDERVLGFARKTAASGADSGRPQPRLRIDGQLPVRAQDPRRCPRAGRAARGHRLRAGPPAGALSARAGSLPTTSARTGFRA